MTERRKGDRDKGDKEEYAFIYLFPSKSGLELQF